MTTNSLSYSREMDGLIGGCDIHVSEPLQGEIGYCFNPLYWREGYATEAAGIMLQFGFQNSARNPIYATCRPENIGSLMSCKKLEMKYEGHLRGHMKHKGEWHNSFQYSILEHEYAGRSCSSAVSYYLAYC